MHKIVLTNYEVITFSEIKENFLIRTEIHLSNYC